MLENEQVQGRWISAQGATRHGQCGKFHATTHGVWCHRRTALPRLGEKAVCLFADRRLDHTQLPGRFTGLRARAPVEPDVPHWAPRQQRSTNKLRLQNGPNKQRAKMNPQVRPHPLGAVAKFAACFRGGREHTHFVWSSMESSAAVALPARVLTYSSNAVRAANTVGRAFPFALLCRSLVFARDDMRDVTRPVHPRAHARMSTSVRSRSTSKGPTP